MPINAYEMVMGHRLFRRELGNASDLIGGVAAGDTKRSRLVATHLAHMVTGLHHHHTAEDELVWPKLHARVAFRKSDIQRMEAQHVEIAASVHAVESLRELWAPSADPQLAVQLKAGVNELSARIDEHMQDEERDMVPLINEHLTDDEWTQCIERGAEYIPKINVRLALATIGLMLQDATPAERRRFLAGLPAPVRMLWKLFGERTFESYRARLYGVTDKPYR